MERVNLEQVVTTHFLLILETVIKYYVLAIPGQPHQPSCYLGPGKVGY